MNLNIDEKNNLFTVIKFIKQFYKITAITIIVGIVAAILFISFSEKKYQASTKILLPPINFNINQDKIIYSFENPVLLIVNLSNTNAYKLKVSEFCNSGELSTPRMREARNFSIKPVRISDVDGIEIQAKNVEPKMAILCVDQVFQLIKNYRNEMMLQIKKNYLKEISNNKIQIQSSIKKISQLSKKDNKKQYNLLLKNINNLRQRGILMEEGLQKISTDQVKLLNGISISHDPVFPNKLQTITTGAIGGLILGILIVLGLRIIILIRIKNKFI